MVLIFLFLVVVFVGIGVCDNKEVLQVQKAGGVSDASIPALVKLCRLPKFRRMVVKSGLVRGTGKNGTVRGQSHKYGKIKNQR